MSAGTSHDRPATLQAKMLRLELLNVRADQERELGRLVLHIAVLDDRPLNASRFRDAPSARFNEPYPDEFRDALRIQHLVAGAVSLVPHWEPRLLHIPSVDEKAHDDGGIGI